MYSSSRHRIKEIVTFVNREGEDLSLGGYVCKEGSVARVFHGLITMEGEWKVIEIISQSVPGQD